MVFGREEKHVQCICCFCYLSLLNYRILTLWKMFAATVLCNSIYPQLHNYKANINMSLLLSKKRTVRTNIVYTLYISGIYQQCCLDVINQKRHFLLHNQGKFDKSFFLCFFFCCFFVRGVAFFKSWLLHKCTLLYWKLSGFAMSSSRLCAWNCRVSQFISLWARFSRVKCEVKYPLNLLSYFFLLHCQVIECQTRQVKASL